MAKKERVYATLSLIIIVAVTFKNSTKYYGPSYFSFNISSSYVVELEHSFVLTTGGFLL